MNTEYPCVLLPIEVPSKKPAWQVKEPEDRTDPVEHERFVQAKPGPRSWLLGASVRGKNHAHFARWREDAFHFDCVGPYAFMAVADGAGSCHLSRVGARIACQVAVNFAKKHLLRYSFDWVTDAAMSDFPHVEESLQKGFLASLEVLEREASIREVDISQLTTTLILVLHVSLSAGHLVGSLQVGDGAVALRNSEKGITILGKPDHGAYSGQSRFLTSSGIENEFGCRVTISRLKNLKCIAVMSDGIADDYFPLEEGLRSFFREMENSVLNSKHPLKALKEWIHYERIGSYDDRTLILLHLP